MTAPGTRKNQMYEIVGPDGSVHLPPKGRCWSTVESGYQELVATDRIRFGITGKGAPGILRYLDEDDGLTPWTWWPHGEVGHTDESKKEIQALFPDASAFDTPKPERLLERIIAIATDPGDLVLDCFAGSGTTAAVAHKMARRWVTVELLEKTAQTFMIPRLSKVVHGQDPGGITAKLDRVAVGELPAGSTPQDAQQFTTLLGRFAKDLTVSVDVVSETTKFVRSLAKTEGAPLTRDESKTLMTLLRKISAEVGEVDVMPNVLKQLRNTAKTKKEASLQWAGGGGFSIAKMGSSMYEIDDTDGEVFLSTAATNGAWSKAVAGQLRFTLTPDDPVFCGVRGRQRLAVIDGVVDDTVVNTVVENLEDRQRALIVAKAVLPGAAELLATLSPGSRLKKAPEQMFSSRTVK